MADELKFTDNPKADRDALDSALIDAIRDVYVPQGGEAYWAGLEQRIMARVATREPGDPAWFSVLVRWARPALIAATAIFAIAGLVNMKMPDSDSQVSYDSVMESATADVGAASDELVSIEHGADGAALSYYLSH